MISIIKNNIVLVDTKKKPELAEIDNALSSVIDDSISWKVDSGCLS